MKLKIGNRLILIDSYKIKKPKEVEKKIEELSNKRILRVDNGPNIEL